MGRGLYYAARAAGRAAVRERTRARQAQERAQQRNPELFKNSNNSNSELGVGGTIFMIIVAIILAILIF